jgi:hypothetical protein
MILICEEHCFRHYTASSAEKSAARERFDLAVNDAADGGIIAVKTIFFTAEPLKRGIRCGNPPEGVTVIVHLHEADDSSWTDLTQQ